MNVIDDLVYLIGCAVNGCAPDEARVRAMDLGAMYGIASQQMVAGIAGAALEAAGVRDSAFTQARLKAASKVVMLEAEKEKLFDRMEAAGIWYMPLKGAVMKDYYPAYGMREMSDYDILFDHTRAEDLKAIMLDMGFEIRRVGRGADDVYHKAPFCHFEMHRMLFAPSDGRALEAYYHDVSRRMIPDEGRPFGRHLSHEDFYIYLVAHEYKYYSTGGTGLKSFIDTYVFLKKFGDRLDIDYIEAESEKLGIADYERRCRDFAMRLFGGQPLTPEDEKMLDYIIESGAFGTQKHTVENKMQSMGGNRLKYLSERLFMPLETVKTAYPFFYRHRIFLPVLFVYRIIRRLTVGRDRTRRELKALAGKKKKG